jgi:HAMP domain-containing protein
VSTAAIPSSTPIKRTFISFQLRLILAFTAVFLLVVGGAFLWFYQFASDVALERVKADLNTTLHSAMAGIDGDAFEQIYADIDPEAAAAAEFPYPTEADNPQYWQHVRWLLQVHEIEPRAFLYTYIPYQGDSDNLIFIGSHGAALDPVEGAPFLVPFPVLEGRENVLGLTDTSYVAEPYTDQFGSWISAFAPIKNSDGDIVGVLGVDYQAEYVLQVRSSIRNAAIPAFALTYLILFSLIFVISRQITRPTVTLTRIAERIGEGNYEQDLSFLTDRRFSDEIVKLAQVFEIMMEKVGNREQKLRQQVEELQIMVDSGKRDQQVKEIVDSEFFNELRAKASDLRARSKGLSTPRPDAE